MYACLVQVVDVMKDNLDKVLERDAKLTTLENRAGKSQIKLIPKVARVNFVKLKLNYFFSEILQTGASQFTTNASKLKRKYWWKNVKVSLCFSLCCS
jgi:hypothetical protein